MISPLILSATLIPSVLLPEAVGPTMATTGVSEDTEEYNDPDDCKQQEAGEELIAGEVH
jgi:hypothetical protein